MGINFKPIAPRDTDTASSLFLVVCSVPAVCEALVSLRERGFVLPPCQTKETLTRSENGIFVGDEDTHTLRLTSELVDLRVEYANPRSPREQSSRPTDCAKQKRHSQGVSLLFGAEGGIRTLVCFWHKLISSPFGYLEVSER